MSKHKKHYGTILLTYPATILSKEEMKKRFDIEANTLFQDMYKEIKKEFGRK